MPARRWLRFALAAAVIAAAAGAAILANLTLLGYAQSQNDPLGTLSPRAQLVPARPLPPPRPAAEQERDD